MKASARKILEKIVDALLDEEGTPTNATGGVAQINAPISKKVAKRPALELDDEDEVDAENLPAISKKKN